jgi:CHAD domain-containing protein
VKNELLGFLDRALGHLRKPQVTDHDVHEARKALKRARAALRLLRPALGNNAYRFENRRLRDAGRALAPLRAPVTLLEALLLLEKGAKLQAGLRKSLHSRRAMARRTLRSDVTRAVGLIEGSRSRAAAFASNDNTEKPLQRIYRRGRKAGTTAKRDGSVEAMHEWRKQVKYLLNALEMLRAHPHRAALADELADALGEDHDLALLYPLAPAGLQKKIARRRAHLQALAFKLRGRLYRQKRL